MYTNTNRRVPGTLLVSVKLFNNEYITLPNYADEDNLFLDKQHNQHCMGGEKLFQKIKLFQNKHPANISSLEV